MANLKGSTLEKQCKDLFHRLESFGKGRYGKTDHQTHSDGLASKREMYARDFKDYMQQHQIEGKMNLAMNSQNVKTFLDERLEGLKHNTQENYIRGFSSLLTGLKESNVNISCDKSVFDAKVVEVKAMATSDTRSGLAVTNADEKIEQLYQKRFETGVLSEVMKDLGIRVSESYEIVKNLEAYYNPSSGTIDNLVGKGNHTYEPKAIGSELVEKIRACEHLPSPNTLRNDLKEVGINNPHQWRYFYSKSEFDTKINEEGVEYHQALREVSEGLNHSLDRKSMTLYYLGKA
jgi:hypothetical protein